MFSSGTSGVPKSVMISHTNLVFQMYQNQIVEDAIAAAVVGLSNNIPTWY
jgi:long-subunit acyl-CoA synthetase (AMP-forming)